MIMIAHLILDRKSTGGLRLYIGYSLIPRLFLTLGFDWLHFAQAIKNGIVVKVILGLQLL